MNQDVFRKEESKGSSDFENKHNLDICVCVKVCQRHLKFYFYAGVQNTKPPNDHQNVSFSFSDGLLWLCIKKKFNLVF